jgi:hypothetical protein
MISKFLLLLFPYYLLKFKRIFGRWVESNGPAFLTYSGRTQFEPWFGHRLPPICDSLQSPQENLWTVNLWSHRISPPNLIKSVPATLCNHMKPSHHLNSFVLKGNLIIETVFAGTLEPHSKEHNMIAYRL